MTDNIVADTTKPVSSKRTRAKRFARQPANAPNSSAEAPTAKPLEDTPAPAAKVSKTDQVLALLRREEGATLAEIVGATGWLPHSTRAALTGLRKKGHAIEKTKRGEVTCYVMKAGA